MSSQKKIFNLFFSLLILVSTSALAQEIKVGEDANRMKESATTSSKEKKKKSPKIHIDRDLKLGMDISNFLIGAVTTNIDGLDFSVDYTLDKKRYAIIEFGHNSYNESSDVLDYFSKGSYVRIGFDSDTRKEKSNSSRDMFYLGLRYAFATYTQRLENAQLSSGYWPSVTQAEVSFDNSAHWGEAIAGFKVEVMKNVYLGLGLRMKILIYQSGDKTISPAVYIPGYGKTSGTLIMGFNYNVYYNLPFNYSKKNK
ncbi:MAG: hypothetical protein JW857_06515 [Bacteroidales bacterium]|nr:hypothetical protein [Bacteroidales bacterium]